MTNMKKLTKCLTQYMKKMYTKELLCEISEWR